MKYRNMIRLILYDIRYFFRQNRWKWLFAFMIHVFLCIRTFHSILFYAGSSDLLSALWQTMGGAREYLLSSDSSFQLPAYWFLFHIYLFFLIGFYPAGELYSGNGQALVRTRTRAMWLISKCISVVVNIVLYYGCFLLTMLIGNLVCGGTVIPRGGIIGLAGIRVAGKSVTELLTAFIFLPVCVSTALGVMQVVLSLFVGPVLSFMLNIAYMTASVFWMKPFFIGNYSMLYRQSWVSGNTNLSVTGGILRCLVLASLSFAVGMLLFQKKDILPES